MGVQRLTVPTPENKQFANGNGVTTVFYFYYRLLLESDIQIYVNNSLINPSNYTVDINSNGIGGSVTFLVAPSAGVNNVLIYRFVNYLQNTHFPNESDFNQISLEDSVDKLTMECQQLQEEVGRCIIAPLTNPDIPFLSLPAPAANNAIGWDPTGTFLVDLPLLDGVLGPAGPTGPTGATGPAGAALDVIVLEDQRANGTNGGAMTAGVWTTLPLNTEVVDSAGICTLSANRFTIPAGTYRIRASSCGNNSNGHQIRLMNISDSTTALVGTQAWNNNTINIQGYAATQSTIDGQITIAASKTFELQLIVANTSSNGRNPGSVINTGELSVFTRIVLERGGTGPAGPPGPTGPSGGTVYANGSFQGYNTFTVNYENDCTITLDGSDNWSYDVVFDTPTSDTTYEVCLEYEIVNNPLQVLTIQSKTTSGFIIQANSITGSQNAGVIFGNVSFTVRT